MEDDDPYAQLAQDQIVSPIKARMRAAKTRAERKLAKQQDDKTIQHELWRRWHRKRVEDLKKGNHSKAINEVSDFLERMTFEDGGALIELIERGPWRQADVDTRYLLLGLINQRIMFLRVAESLAPFDDAIPFSDEEPTTFEIIRGILNHDE